MSRLNAEGFAPFAFFGRQFVGRAAGGDPLDCRIESGARKSG
jgi:hypothetical protein